MASLFYTVWKSAGPVARGFVLSENTVDIAGTSTTAANVIDPAETNIHATRRVRVFCDANAFVTWSVDPTALGDGTGGRPMGSENPEYFHMKAGDKIAVIERT